jgi:hypothetical protein
MKLRLNKNFKNKNLNLLKKCLIYKKICQITISTFQFVILLIIITYESNIITRL